MTVRTINRPGKSTSSQASPSGSVYGSPRASSSREGSAPSLKARVPGPPALQRSATLPAKPLSARAKIPAGAAASRSPSNTSSASSSRAARSPTRPQPGGSVLRAQEARRYGK
jgi:hypothetical protein